MTTLTRRQRLGVALSAAEATAAWLPPSVLMAKPSGFDHSHAAWTALLRKHDRLVRGSQTTQVAYAGFWADRSALKAYLDSLSAASPATFGGWTQAEHQALLINACNAFTFAHILTRYPDLRSIKDLDSLLSSPWEPKRVGLLDTQVSLDDIEHAIGRRRGVHDDLTRISHQ